MVPPFRLFVCQLQTLKWGFEMHSKEGDYANPIEPSAQGGEKIARAIVELVGQGFTGGRTEVFF